MHQVQGKKKRYSDLYLCVLIIHRFSSLYIEYPIQFPLPHTIKDKIYLLCSTKNNISYVKPQLTSPEMNPSVNYFTCLCICPSPSECYFLESRFQVLPYVFVLLFFFSSCSKVIWKLFIFFNGSNRMIKCMLQVTQEWNNYQIIYQKRLQNIYFQKKKNVTFIYAFLYKGTCKRK